MNKPKSKITRHESKRRTRLVISANKEHIEEYGLGTALTNSAVTNSYKITERRAKLSLENIISSRSE